jgi:hypothetical protein
VRMPPGVAGREWQTSCERKTTDGHSPLRWNTDQEQGGTGTREWDGTGTLALGGTGTRE